MKAIVSYVLLAPETGGNRNRGTAPEVNEAQNLRLLNIGSIYQTTCETRVEAPRFIFWMIISMFLLRWLFRLPLISFLEPPPDVVQRRSRPGTRTLRSLG